MQNYDPSHFVDVDLDAPPKLRWRPAIVRMGDAIHAIVCDVVDHCEEYLDAFPAWLRPIARVAAHGGASLAGRLTGSVASLYRQEYSSEIKSIANAAGVSYPQLLLGNLIYDITQIVDYRSARSYPSPMGCSSFSCNLPGDTPILARNMDWAIPESVGRHTVLVRLHRGRRSYLSVGVAGMVGVVSAIYPGHWAVALNQAPVTELGVRHLQTPALQRLRQACDQFGGYRDLVRRIQEYQTMSPFFAHVVGRRAEEHCVVEGLGDSFSTRDMEDSCLIQTNHFVDEELAEYNGPDEWEEDGVVWMCDSKPRYRSLERRLQRRPRTMAEAIGKLKRQPVQNENTMQQMVFCPARGEWELKVAS